MINSQTLTSVPLAIILVSKCVWTLKEGSGVSAEWGLNWPTLLTVEVSDCYDTYAENTHTHNILTFLLLQILMSVTWCYITVSRSVRTPRVDSTVAAMRDFSCRMTWGHVKVSQCSSFSLTIEDDCIVYEDLRTGVVHPHKKWMGFRWHESYLIIRTTGEFKLPCNS